MRKALGKGLEALFPATPAAPPAPGERLVAVEDIVSNPDQPRRHFDEETLAALADSIRRYGLLQPLVVRAAGERYELIAGERRLRAAQRAGLERVPVELRARERRGRGVEARSRGPGGRSPATAAQRRIGIGGARRPPARPRRGADARARHPGANRTPGPRWRNRDRVLLRCRARSTGRSSAHGGYQCGRDALTPSRARC